jgi:hypothetical protein
MIIKAKGKLIKLSVEVIDIEEEYNTGDGETLEDFYKEVENDLIEDRRACSGKDIKYAAQDRILDWGFDVLHDNENVQKAKKENVDFLHVLSHYDIRLLDFHEMHSNHMIINTSAKIED